MVNLNDGKPDALSPNEWRRWPAAGRSWLTVPGEITGDLLGVSGFAANDVWFVGGAADNGLAFIFYWDGATITAVAHPNQALQPPYAVTVLATGRSTRSLRPAAGSGRSVRFLPARMKPEP